MGEHVQGRPALGTAEKAKLAATAFVCLAVAFSVFYETVPALNGGHRDGEGEWRTEPPPPYIIARDFHTSRLAYIYLDRNSIVLQIPSKRPQKLSELLASTEKSFKRPGTVEDDKLYVVFLEGGTSVIRAPSGLAKRFQNTLNAAKYDETFDLVGNLLASCPDTEASRELTGLLGQRGEPHH